MSFEVSLTVEGQPGPMGSRTMGEDKEGRKYNRPSSKIGWQFKQRTAAEAEAKWWQLRAESAPGPAERWRQRGDGSPIPLEPPYSIRCTFFFKEPAKSEWDWPSTNDLDKLCRAALDGLTQGRLLLDDRHVTRLELGKNYAADRDFTLITIVAHGAPV